MTEPTNIPTPGTPIPGVKEVAKTKAEISEKNRIRRDQILGELNAILAAHGGLESNIGVTHKYWDLLKEYRSLEPETL